MPAKVTDPVVAGPTKPADTASKPTANKRPCIHASIAPTKTTHSFFQRLSARPKAVRAHFEKHYLPTSRLCPCDLFPVYASKVEGVPKLPIELNVFCLQYIAASLVTLGGPLVRALESWAPGFVPEMEAYYIPFYEEKERKELEQSAPQLRWTRWRGRFRMRIGSAGGFVCWRGWALRAGKRG